MSPMRAVLLPLGVDLYALPVEWVREVLAAPPITRLVTAPPLVLGLFNLRGEIIPLLDTSVLLDIGRGSTATHAVVLSGPPGTPGLAATGCPRDVRLSAPVGPSRLFGTAGTYRVGDRVAVLLDPEPLLARCAQPRPPESGVG